MFLKARKVEVPDLEDPSRPALLDPELRAFVNWEIYFLRDRKALRKFRKDPLRACGTLTDPVSGVRFNPTKSSPRLDFNDRPYFFSSDSTFATFKTFPDSFAVRRGM